MDYKEEIQKLVEEIKAQGYENVCMWMPAYNLGGGSAFLRFAKYLVENTDLTVYYMDYKDGYLEYLLKQEPRIKFLHYSEDMTTFPVKEKCIIITNSTRVVQMPQMNPENKLLFWHWETVPCAWSIVLIDNEVKKYLKLTKDNHAMVYHDWSAKDSLNRYQHIGFNNNDYLPLTLYPKICECKKGLINDDEINLCFLSRLAPDKKNSLYYLTENFAKYKTSKKKRLHIIGDGVSADEVKNFCEDYKKEIEFIFYGTVAREDLDNYLINNVDILFAVGTSVLEGASLKLPSVVLLMDNKYINDDEAFWIYNTKEYCMGILTSEKDDFGVQYTTFDKIIDSVYKETNGKETEGQKCYEYYLNNHSSFDNTVCFLLKFFKQTELTYKKLKKCIKYTPYLKLELTKTKLLGLNLIKKSTHLNKTKIYFLNIPIYKKVICGGKTKKYFLGIPCYKTIQDKNTTNHYIFGLKLAKSKRMICWRPIATAFKDKKRG